MDALRATRSSVETLEYMSAQTTEVAAALLSPSSTLEEVLVYILFESGRGRSAVFANALFSRATPPGLAVVCRQSNAERQLPGMVHFSCTQVAPKLQL
jgi:hypothetical protein